MRDILSKLMTGSMVAGAALLVSACGGSETANTTDTNMTDMNSSMSSDMGTMNDVTAVDATAGSDGNMATDNSAMMGNAGDAMGNSTMNGSGNSM